MCWDVNIAGKLYSLLFIYLSGGHNMKKLKIRRIASAVMAVLMTVALMPTGMTATRVNAETPSESSSNQGEWNFITYGNGIKTDDSSKIYTSCEGSLNDGNTVQLTAGGLTDGVMVGSDKHNWGKLVPASFDGLSFYYTSVPTNKNFELRAKVKVDQWYLTNGQEGFGLMAADKCGGSGWNNSYMALASQTIYRPGKDGEPTSDEAYSPVKQRLGIEIREKSGLTKDNIKAVENGDREVISQVFSSTEYPLEQRYPNESNLIGNFTNEAGKLTNNVNITEMYLTIGKNNTGYYIKYEPLDGSDYSTTKQYYEPDILSQLDTDNVYVGFFVSRFAQATYSDVTLNIYDPSQDSEAIPHPTEELPLNASISSEATTNSSNYNLAFNSNSDGVANVYENGKLINTVDVKANETANIATQLNVGENIFNVKFKPTDGFKPSKYSVLDNYDERTYTKKVTYQAYTGSVIYVSPEGNGNGTKENPADLQTAIRFAQPGQKIVCKEGTYAYSSTLTIPRGTNGREDAMIYLIADPEASSRPVFSGEKAKGHAMEVAGNYWFIQGIDVANSVDTKDGMHVSGSFNTIDDVEVYNNGNTGLQISRLSANDDRDMWPQHNLILNTTSHDNADSGYEDADGFGAKLTCGEGNVFDGCISYCNADDGFDFFAKVQTGSIGSVTIKNSVSYGNGYLSNGKRAGNGNGFKMGGDSVAAGHVLQNSFAFDNKSKGIDCNSCPDIKIFNSTTFNNAANNVALYTNYANETDFSADGILSYKTDACGTQNTGENFKFKGKQAKDPSAVFKSTDYFWKTVQGDSIDSSKVVTDDWFKSVDTGYDYKNHTYETLPVTRDADGRINMHGLLELTDKAPLNVGARFNADVLSANPVISIDGDETTGFVEAIDYENVAADEDEYMPNADTEIKGEVASDNTDLGAVKDSANVSKKDTKTADSNNLFVVTLITLMAAATIILIVFNERKNIGKFFTGK